MPAEAHDRTLKRNNIQSFILRIDLLPNENIAFDSSINKIGTLFDRQEKRIIEGLVLNINNNVPILNPAKDFEYVLVSDTKNVTMTFSKPQQAFWFETSAYIDKTTYKSIFDHIQSVFAVETPSLIAKRIGMRFINEFQCKQISDIKKVLKTNHAKIVTEMLADANLTRAIAYKEYNYDSIKSRVQFGVTNKFYPSVISTYDLSLDIDVYSDLQIPVLEWNQKISELNHKAYDYFLSLINDKYLENLK